MEEMRVDDLAQAAGVATTTIRLYQNKGLLPPPRIEGRTGWYGAHHLARLRLIGRLQADGFSLAGIGRLLEEWERGRGLDAIVGVETELDALLSDRHSIVMEPQDLIGLFPEGSMTPDLVQRAAAAGLVELTDDGKFRLPDRRFAQTGAALARMGVPLAVVLDEWDALIAHTDDIASRFVAIFQSHLMPPDWRDGLDAAEAAALGKALAELQTIAHDVVHAALDTSLSHVGRQRLQRLLPSRPSADTGAAGNDV